MEASNDVREWEKERHEQQGLQFQNGFVGWDFRESPQSGPSMTRSAKSSTEHEYASKCPILGSSRLFYLDLSEVLTLDS
jgi:hypothetical protein